MTAQSLRLCCGLLTFGVAALQLFLGFLPLLLLPAGNVPLSWVLLVSAQRVGVTDTTDPGGTPCASTTNTQLPVTIDVRLETDAGVGIEGETIRLFKVAPDDQYGGFCPSV